MEKEAVMTKEVVEQLSEAQIEESMKHGYAVLDSVLTNALDEKYNKGYIDGFGKGFKYGALFFVALGVGMGIGVLHIHLKHKKDGKK